MGAYLSSPVTDKVSCDKTCPRFTYGASCMQGWRISQEDAHNCLPDFDVDKNTSFFAVYDGHGGSEVAQYCALHLPKCIKETEQYKNGELGEALVDAFLKFDARLVEEDVVKDLKALAGEDENEEEEEEDDPVGRGETDALKAEANLPLDELLAKYQTLTGGAARSLRKKEAFQSPMVRSKADPSEPGKSSSEAEAGPTSTSDGDPETPGSSGSRGGASSFKHRLSNGLADNDNNINKEKELQGGQETRAGDCDSGGAVQSSSSATSNKDSDNKDSGVGEASSSAEPSSSGCASSSGSGSGSSRDLADSSCNQVSSSSSSSSGVSGAGSSSSSSGVSSSTSSQSSSSAAGGSTSGSSVAQESSGKSAAQSSGGGSSSSAEVDGPTGSGVGGSSASSKTGPKSDSVDMEDDSDDDEEEEGDEDEWQDESEEEEDDDDEEEEGMDGTDGPMMDMSNEEPGSDSGCTACVALLCTDRLIVANAGDSRCVLSRNGKAVDLSFDHKPEDDPERTRIEKAGGKVTADGRVNGGLNLSRAIGDHFYKRKEDLPPEEQMITALPDIKEIALEPEDQFVVLACDGIWNYMSSQEVVDYVGERVKDPEKRSKPSLICEELFEHCLAPNTYGDGTGCDNMTCIVVVFPSAGENCGAAGDGMPPSKRCAKELDTSAEQTEKRPRVDGESEGADSDSLPDSAAEKSD